MKPPKPANERERLQALQNLAIFDAPLEEGTITIRTATETIAADRGAPGTHADAAGRRRGSNG